MSLLCSNLTLICLLAHFPGGSDGKESFCNARNAGLIPQSEGSPGEGNGNPLQYSCQGNPMDRGAWWVTVHRVTRVGHNLATKQQENDEAEKQISP